MVVPPDLIDTFTHAHLLSSGQVSVLDQVVLAKYLQEGYFERHIRRMRALYGERQAVLVDAAQELNGLLDISASEAGMHLVGWLSPNIDEWAAAKAARLQNVLVSPLSAFSINPVPRKGLLLGYAAADPLTLREGVRNLTTALRTLVN